MKNKNLISFYLCFIRHSEKAVCFAEKEKPRATEECIWFPKSQIEVDGIEHPQDYEELTSNEWVDVNIPQWLAKQEGLI